VTGFSMWRRRSRLRGQARLPAPHFLLAFALILACSSPSHYLERRVTLNEHVYRYRVWLPPHYTKIHHWPVVLFLHGSGERGDDNLRQITVGLGPALQQFSQRYKCVVVFPQCRFGEEWYGEMELQALAGLEQTMREFRGDPKRVYLTGVSMGGAGAWYLARHPRRFAAVVPVCGEVVRQADDPFPSDPPPDLERIVHSPDPYGTLARAIGSTPVWAFHGAADDTVPVTESRSMVSALRQLHRNVRYTEYPGVGHDAWDLAYADANLVKWLLQQKLR
jgi:predicted peptidase